MHPVSKEPGDTLNTSVGVGAQDFHFLPPLC